MNIKYGDKTKFTGLSGYVMLLSFPSNARLRLLSTIEVNEVILWMR
jgi:hypothetical protein